MNLLSRLPLVAALSAALALSACSDSSDSEPVAAESAPVAVEPAPPVVEVAPVLDPAAQLAAALKNPARSPENIARDVHRHPEQTLTFFGLAPDQTVIEITPGGGWYTEILAPYLRESGRYVAAMSAPGAVPLGRSRQRLTQYLKEFQTKLASNALAFDRANVVEFDQNAPVFGPPESADRVLTFRNVHNWMTPPTAQGMFNGFFAVLKPGGVLGVVEHRAKADVPAGDRSGYLGEAQVIAFATAAGFLLEEASEINANPKDTKDHPNGVWTLPPTLDLPEGEDAQKYKDIGESDRMTLRFVKPVRQAAPAPAN